MKKIEGGVTAAKGFAAASAAAQIKYKGRDDMALVYSALPCAAAGTFTTNVVKAAPVIWDRDLIRSGAAIRAVVVNSGIANACTGQEGLDYCRRTAQAAASALRIPEDSVLVALDDLAMDTRSGTFVALPSRTSRRGAVPRPTRTARRSRCRAASPSSHTRPPVRRTSPGSRRGVLSPSP